ncbi:MAG: hypothetical protein AB8G15_08870 [Saprospiraceae bacterium]
MKNKILKTYKKHKFAQITRAISKQDYVISSGFLVKVTDKFVVLQETEDFRLLGCVIFKTSTIREIRNNKNDRFYDKIMKAEGTKKLIGPKTKVEVTSWQTIFKSLKKAGSFVIVECEGSEKNHFVIGKITAVNKKSVAILYFDARGRFEKEATKIKFKKITKVTFDDHYIDTFKKYVKK